MIAGAFKVMTRPGVKNPRGPARFRGDVAAVLNRLAHEGLIAGYRTNCETGQVPERLEVTVDPPDDDKPNEQIQGAVREALAPLHQDVAVVVANKPALSSKLADELGGFA
jgi:hypothetical protein